MPTSTAILNVQLIFDTCFACTCFGSSSIFAYGLRWYKMFADGREDVNDEERAGRPSTSTTDENIDEVKKIVLVNRRIAVREVAKHIDWLVPFYQ